MKAPINRLKAFGVSMGSKVVVYIFLLKAKESIRLNIHLNQLVNGFEILKWFDEMMAKG